MTLETIFEEYDAEQIGQTEQEIEHSDVQNDEEMTSDYPEDGMSELAHIGVKFRSGRWPYGSGERPHQHLPDGTENKLLFDDGTYDWKTVNEMTTDFKTGMNATQTMYNDMRKYIDPANKSLPKTNFLPKAKKMSDEELRAAINRMQMEQNYNRMMQEMDPAKRSLSEQKLMKALVIGGGLVAAGASVAGIVNNISEMNSRKQKMAQEALDKAARKATDKKAVEQMTKIMKRVGFDPDKILTADDLKDYATNIGRLNKLYNFFNDNVVID